MPITPVMYSLAPTDLPVLRGQRYDGDGFGVPMGQFAPVDRAIIRRMYDIVRGIYDDWLPTHSVDLGRLTARLRQLDETGFVESARALGQATLDAGGGTPMIQKVIHDLRGGGLTALVGAASMLLAGCAPDDTSRVAVFLARDHAKIMRNALLDIDLIRRNADKKARVHGIQDFIDKWDGVVTRMGDRKVAFAVESTYHGCISACCLENSAIDRILFNYLNNAARFTADGRVNLGIFTLEEGKLVRWVVDNAVTAEQAAWLARVTGGDFRRLFRGGLTRDGQGIGLTSCADFAAASFGLADAGQAVDRHYIGAKLMDGRYYAWFHWPSCDATSDAG